MLFTGLTFCREISSSTTTSDIKHDQFHANENIMLDAEYLCIKKSFVCHICNRGFSRKDSLKNHSRIHTGDGLYVCPECHKACVTKQELRRHLRIHTGEKPFKCSHCSYSATLKVSLKSHMLTQHSLLI